MATKDYCSPYHDDFVGETFENQLKNLNLNQNHKCFSVDTIQSKSITKTDNKKSLNNVQNICDKEELKEGKHSSANSSTLSLHIAAYENSIENSSKEFCENPKIKNEKLSLVKRWETAKQSMIQNPFEFPRQQGSQNIEPEIMQFKASQKLLNPNFSETELLYWTFKNIKLIYSLLGLFIGTIYALTNCTRFSRRNNNNNPEVPRQSEKDKLESIEKPQQIQKDFAKSGDETDMNKSSKESTRNGKKLDLSSIRDSIKVAKINQQRNSPNKEVPGKNGGGGGAAKTIYTKSGESNFDKSTFESTMEASVKFVSAESLTDEIVVPVGKTSRTPVPQSSLTSLNNLKIHGQPRSEVAVKFGEERISIKRTKSLNEAI